MPPRSRHCFNLLATSLLCCGMAAAPVFAADNAVPVQPEPASEMMFERMYPKAAQPAKAYPQITLQVSGIEADKPIPAKFAYCQSDGSGKTIDAGNTSPAIHWQNAPQGAKSFVLLVTDPDVPADFSHANQSGKEIAVNAPRQPFYHWVLTDIPPTLLGIFEGADSKGITPGGKQVGRRAYGVNGKNDYSKVFPGNYGGYDGPCPPWNDLRMHHYHFTLYALDVASLNLPVPATGPQALTAMEGHIIGKGEVIGTYTNNPRWLAQLKKEAAVAKEDEVPGTFFDPKEADKEADRQMQEQQ